jgi:HK97 family phage major capsid protein
MHAYLSRLVAERTSLTEIMTRMADKAVENNEDLAEAERAEISRMQTRCAELDTQIGEHNAQLESARAYATLMERVEAQRDTAGRPPERRGGGPVESTSFSQAWVDSEQFRAYSGHGTSGRFQIANYLETRAAITTASLPIPHVIAPPVEQQYRSLLVSMVNTMRVSGNTVDWVEIGPDPTAVVTAEGSAKTEATVTFTPKTASLETLAHWYQITRQALDDAAYLRSLLEGKLRRGLLKKIDTDIAALIVASVAISTTVNANLNTAIRQAVGVVEGFGYSPNAVLLNPADFAALDVAASSAPGGDPSTRRSTFWGLTPVSVPTLAAGVAYVGDFQSAVTLADRGVSDVFLSDSHQDLFIKNTLVLLAETRVKSFIDEPLGICKTAAA